MFLALPNGPNPKTNKVTCLVMFGVDKCLRMYRPNMLFSAVIIIVSVTHAAGALLQGDEGGDALTQQP